MHFFLGFTTKGSAIVASQNASGVFESSKIPVGLLSKMEDDQVEVEVGDVVELVGASLKGLKLCDILLSILS